MLFNILKIKPIFGDFVIRYRFLMLFVPGLSIVRNRFWVHIRWRFDILKYRAALIPALITRDKPNIQVTIYTTGLPHLLCRSHH